MAFQEVTMLKTRNPRVDRAPVPTAVGFKSCTARSRGYSLAGSSMGEQRSRTWQRGELPDLATPWGMCGGIVLGCA
jgi:hypothetical protein